MEMSCSLNLSTIMPPHQKKQKKQRQAAGEMLQAGKESEKVRGESIANGIAIRFIPQQQQQEETGRKAG